MGTIKSVQSSMGYAAALDRTDTCTHCTHFEKVDQGSQPPFDKPKFMCRKGGFYTTYMAVCNQHELKKVGS